MHRYRRFTVSDYIVYGLLAVGLISLFISHPGPFIIPFVVVGVIFLLYKFPPNRLRSRYKARHDKRSYQARQNEREKRKTNFKVIYGNKPNSEDEPPPFH